MIRQAHHPEPTERLMLINKLSTFDLIIKTIL